PLLINAQFALKTPQKFFRVLLEFSSQPRPGHLPVTLNRGVANPQHFSGFFNGEPTEKLQFDDSFLLRIDDGQLLQSFMQGQKIQDWLDGQVLPAHLTSAGNRESLLFRSAAFRSLMLE